MKTLFVKDFLERVPIGCTRAVQTEHPNAKVKPDKVGKKEAKGAKKNMRKSMVLTRSQKKNQFKNVKEEEKEPKEESKEDEERTKMKLSEETWFMCLDETKSEMIMLECMHSGCVSCISKWFSEKDNCPIWKRPLTKNFIFYLKPGNIPSPVPSREIGEFEWSFLPGDIWKETRFLDVSDRDSWEVKVGKRQLDK